MNKSGGGMHGFSFDAGIKVEYILWIGMRR